MSLGRISLEDFAVDPLLGAFGEASPAQRLVLRLLDGLPPANQEQRDLFEVLAGRAWGDDLVAPRVVVAFVLGADGGKSIMASLLLLHRCLFASLQGLRPGQRGYGLLVAPDTRLASIPLAYASGICKVSPIIRAELEAEPTSDSIKFHRGTEIAVLPATIGGRAVRGRRFVAAVLEEVAFFRDSDYRVNDLEIVRAIRPRLLDGAQLVGISTPYAKRGWLWNVYRNEWGKCRRALVLQASTEVMRPDKKAGVLADLYEDDPTMAAAELGAEFLDGLADFLTEDQVEAITVSRGDIPPAKGQGPDYRAFADPSGGSRDAFTVAIGHVQDDVAIADVVRAWPAPFKPTEVVAEAAALLKSYGVTSVTGDRYAGEWPREAFAKEGVHYNVAEKNKSELYLEMLPAINSRRVELPDDAALRRELRGLERRRGSGGKDKVDHRPGLHDDRANAVAGLVVELIAQPESGPSFVGRPAVPYVPEPMPDMMTELW